MIESAGFEVIDLGVDVPASKVIECYKENPDVKVIALSALLTTTMPALKDTVAALNAEDFRSNVKIMVGGAPITKEFAERSAQVDIQKSSKAQQFLQKLWQHKGK